MNGLISAAEACGQHTVDCATIDWTDQCFPACLAAADLACSRIAAHWLASPVFRRAVVRVCDKDRRPTEIEIDVVESALAPDGQMLSVGGSYGLVSSLDVTRLKFDRWMTWVDAAAVRRA